MELTDIHPIISVLILILKASNYWLFDFNTFNIFCKHWFNKEVIAKFYVVLADLGRQEIQTKFYGTVQQTKFKNMITTLLEYGLHTRKGENGRMETSLQRVQSLIYLYLHQVQSNLVQQPAGLHWLLEQFNNKNENSVIFVIQWYFFICTIYSHS